MAINTVNNGMYAPPVRGGGHVERAAPAKTGSLPGGGLPDKPVGEVDQVQWTSSLQKTLHQMEEERHEQPFDEKRVAALRKAITNGEYQANPNRIARKMIDFEL